ncbi:MAG: hypothetical protein AAF548_14745 [Actinomycetota bacterium]
MADLRLLPFVVAALCAACSADASPGPATEIDAVAAYVVLDEDGSLASGLMDDLTLARQGEPSSPAGFVPGIRASFQALDSESVFGVRLVFQSSATTSDRLELARRANELGLGDPIWLSRSDPWPDCAGEPDCDDVGESEALP